MTTKVEKTVLVEVPVRVAYDQWTQFEEFPAFMDGVKEVRQLDDSRLQWVAEIAGVRREWVARILEQVPEQKIAWAAIEGATNAGAVLFSPAGPGRTTVTLSLEYEPEGIVEKVGDKVHVVERQAEGDLDRFKAFIEARGVETGAWRGTLDEGGVVGTPGVEAATLSRGDDGKAGVSGKVVAAGAAVAAAGVAAAAAGRKGGEDEEPVERVEPAPPAATAERAVPGESEPPFEHPIVAPDGPLSADRRMSHLAEEEALHDPGVPTGADDAGEDLERDRRAP